MTIHVFCGTAMHELFTNTSIQFEILRRGWSSSLTCSVHACIDVMFEIRRGWHSPTRFSSWSMLRFLAEFTSCRFRVSNGSGGSSSCAVLDRDMSGRKRMRFRTDTDRTGNSNWSSIVKQLSVTEWFICEWIKYEVLVEVIVFIRTGEPRSVRREVYW